MNRSQLPQVLTAALVACGVVLADTPAQATPSPAPVSTADHIEDGGDHYAGSQIARHEGRHGAPYAGKKRSRTLGNDVSRWQGKVDWAQVVRKGAKFSYIKATEGTGYRNRYFAQQYNGARRAGLIRGAYHFARPDISSGPRQANYFVKHGGRWSRDGRTLPGMVDLEYNPYDNDLGSCYGRSKSGIVKWIKGFSITYLRRTGRRPVIYTSTSWWKKCTGNSPAFGKNHRLWIARYNSFIGELPAGWKKHTIWQFSDKGKLPGDQNYFNGNMRKLRAVAKG
ncbi:MAG: lysozyme [Haloechinothrix sp.]